MGSIPSTGNPKEQNKNNDPAVRDTSPEIKSNVMTDDSNAQQPSNSTYDKQMNSPKSESKSETDETDALPPDVSGANESVEDVSSTDDTGGSGKPTKDSKTKIASLEAEVRQLRDEKHKLFIRLSEMGAVRLTENNPNISDLSDPNRPEKLVEQFSELYDNEWTNVFECLTQVYGLQENEIIRQLLDILQKIYQICLESTRTQADDLKKAIVSYLGLSEEDKDQSAIKETEKGLQERRAKEFKRNLDLVTEVVREKLKDQLHGKNHEALDKYVQKCTNICWLMCIKDPQMHLYFGENHNDRSLGDDANNDSLHFDATKFTGFTTTGMYLEYVVWPAVYLYKNGPIVKKGVAQGSNTKLETKESTGTNKGENAKDNGDQNTMSKKKRKKKKKK